MLTRKRQTRYTTRHSTGSAGFHAAFDDKSVSGWLWACLALWLSQTPLSIGAYFDAMEQDWEPLSYDPQTFIEQDDEVAVFLIASVRAKATGKTARSWVSHWWTFEGNRFVKVVEVFDGTKALMAMTPD